MGFPTMSGQRITHLLRIRPPIHSPARLPRYSATLRNQSPSCFLAQRPRASLPPPCLPPAPVPPCSSWTEIARTGSCASLGCCPERRQGSNKPGSSFVPGSGIQLMYCLHQQRRRLARQAVSWPCNDRKRITSPLRALSFCAGKSTKTFQRPASQEASSMV